jgi:hypothetical protein
MAVGHGAAPMQGIEDGNPIRAAHGSLAIDRERPGPELRCGPRDRWIAPAPVIASPGEQADVLAVAANDEAIALAS